MRALHRKLLRDLWQIKSQVLAIAAVIGAGVAMQVSFFSTLDSLRITQTTYYERYRFADVFAGMKRAPLRLRERIAAIPGVATVETRVVVDVTLDVPDFEEPATGRLVSVPERRRPALNDVFLRRGRYIEAGRTGEVLAGEAFATAHGLEVGDRIGAVINGHRKELTIVGIALSPEYIYSIRPGEVLPDDERFGVFWMGREALANAFQMKGGFNDVALALAPGAQQEEVITRLDRLIKPYGGLGAIPRSQQVSHWYLSSEFTQLENSGTIMPLIFLAVAAFLLNVVLSRIIAVQRTQVAVLKAVGYSNREVGMHYVEWGLVTAVVGAVLGTAGGVWMGTGLTRLYTDFYHFPLLLYRLSPGVVVAGFAVSLVAAVVGAVGAVRQAVALPPAEAMRPEPPASYRPAVVERFGLRRWLSQPARMVLRNLERSPLRAGLSVLGIALAVAMLIVGRFSLDGMDLVTDILFHVAQRGDMTVTFVEPTSGRALDELTRLPGVMAAEPFRAVAARLHHDHRSRQVGITGVPADARLNRVVDASLEVVELPPGGLVLSAKLAEILGAEIGDTLTLEVLEGDRPTRRVPLTATVDDFMGTSAYMDLAALHRLMREGETLSGAHLLVDEAHAPALYRRLKATPRVAGVMLKEAAMESLNKTVQENVGLMTTFNLLFAGIIAFGVVYNAARTSLSERNRELASLRVMGFTRAEISAILLGELAVLTLLALPLGLALGYVLAALLSSVLDTELYRIPLVISSFTYAFAVVGVLAAAVVSGLAVRRRLDHLDLIGVLKTRE